MNLRRPYDPYKAFDVLTAVLALAGIVLFFISWPAGGAWRILSLFFALGVCLIVYGIFVEPGRLVVRRYREALVRQPGAWLRIVFVSDLHAGGYDKVDRYARIATEVQALDPDILFLGGDYVLDLTDVIQDLKPLAAVTARLGRYFILGNHDFIDAPQRIRETLRGWGFADLTNASIVVRKDGHLLQLTALDDHWLGKPIVPPLRASSVLPHVTVSHLPDAVMDLAHGDTDMVISGHTHGGQIRLPFIGSIVPIPAKLGRLVDRGRKLVHGIPVIISSGAGETDFRLRLFCPPEIVVVEVGI